MRAFVFAAFALAFLTFGAASASAQYVDIYRINQIAKDVSDEQILSGIAGHLGVSADVLKKEKADHNLSFGELYFAHQLAKAAKSDLKTVVSEFRSGKVWGIIAKEKNVNIDEISKDARQLETALKKSRRDP